MLRVWPDPTAERNLVRAPRVRAAPAGPVDARHGAARCRHARTRYLAYETNVYNIRSPVANGPERGAAVIGSRDRSPTDTAWHDLPRGPCLDHAAPTGDDDLAGRLWRRAAGLATGVLAATTLGMVLGGFGALVAGGAAATFAYGVGPLVLAAEVRRFPLGQPATGLQLGRHWAAAAMVAVTLASAVSLIPSGSEGLAFAVLFVGIGTPIAAGAAIAAVVIGARLPWPAVWSLAAVVPLTLLGLLAREVARGPEAPELGVVDAALLLAVIALVPLTVPLSASGTADRRTGLAAVTLLAGGWAAVAIVLPQGLAAAAATGPWVVWCVVLAAAASVRWLRRRRASTTSSSRERPGTSPSAPDGCSRTVRAWRSPGSGHRSCSSRRSTSPSPARSAPSWRGRRGGRGGSVRRPSASWCRCCWRSSGRSAPTSAHRPCPSR